MPDIQCLACGSSSYMHFDAAKTGVRQTPRRVVRKQVLGAQLVANLTEGIVQFRNRSRVKILAAGVLGDLNQCMFATSVAASARFNRHDDDAVYDGLRFLRSANGFFVIDLAYGVSAVSDHHHNLAT